MPILELNPGFRGKQQFRVVGEICTRIILMQLDMTRGNEPNRHNAHSQL